MWHNTITVNEAVDKLKNLSHEENTIPAIKSAICDILEDFSQEEKKQVGLQLSVVESTDAIQQRNLWFIVPNIAKWGNWNSRDKEEKKPHWTDESFGNYNSLIDQWKMFDPNLVKNKDFSEMKTIFEKDHIDHLSDSDKDIVKSISDELKLQNWWKELNKQSNITVPVYALEDWLDPLVRELLSQEWDLNVILYVNAWSKVNKTDWSGQEIIQSTWFTQATIDNKISEIQSLVSSHTRDLTSQWKYKWDKQVFVLWNLYDMKPTIWKIRADMCDAAVLATDSSVKNPIMTTLDADVYDMQDWYIDNVKKRFNEHVTMWDKHLSLVTAQRRWSNAEDPDQRFMRYAEIIYLMWGEILDEQYIPTIETSWRTSSYDLNDYMKVKWFDRWLSKWEDCQLGHKMLCFYWDDKNKNLSVWEKTWKKLHSDPRRWEQAIASWSSLFDQWSGTFAPVDKSKINYWVIKNYNDIMSKLMTNQNLSLSELKSVEDWTNWYCANPIFKWLWYKLSRFWNINVKSSLYNMEVNRDSSIRFTAK